MQEIRGKIEIDKRIKNGGFTPEHISDIERLRSKGYSKYMIYTQYFMDIFYNNNNYFQLERLFK